MDSDGAFGKMHCLVTYPKEVPVCVVIEPVVYYHVPGSVVVCIGCGVPPVLKAQLSVKSNSAQPILQIYFRISRNVD